jgi:hypothetical protein
VHHKQADLSVVYCLLPIITYLRRQILELPFEML